MDSNIDFLRKFVNNHVLRMLSRDALSFVEISESILRKTEKAYYFREQALFSCLKQLVDEGHVNSNNGSVATDSVFNITENGKKLIKNSVTSWDLSKEMLERVFNNSYKVYSADEVDDAMYGRTGIALVNENGVIGIDFYFNDVFQYKPSNSYMQLSIMSQRESRKTEALALLGIVDKEAEIVEQPVLPENASDESFQNTREKKVSNEEKKSINSEAAADDAAPHGRKCSLDEFIRTNELKNTDSPYRATLDAMFGSRNDNIVAETITPKSQGAVLTVATSSYADLKERMMRVGYKLRPYVKQTTSSYYSMNFIFSNKIKRDCYAFVYFAMLIQIVLGYFFVDRYVGIGFVAYISTAAALLVLPIYAWINYLVHPDKRIRAQFDFKITIAGALMLYVNMLVITILLGFFAFKADIYDINSMIIPIFYPAALLLNMPLSVVIYNLLYKTEKYHLS